MNQIYGSVGGMLLYLRLTDEKIQYSADGDVAWHIRNYANNGSTGFKLVNVTNDGIQVRVPSRIQWTKTSRAITLSFFDDTDNCYRVYDARVFPQIKFYLRVVEHDE